MKIRKNEGFTLIELLIVVAIIAILAAIAIPQFSAYRIKGYNAAATADLRNGRTAEEAFFSDWQAYSSSAAKGAAGAGAVMASGTGAANNFPIIIKAGDILAATYPSADTQFNMGLSQNVTVIVNTDANAQSFVGVTHNASGDRCFGMDSDVSAIYWVNATTGSLAGTEAPASKQNADDINTVAGKGSCAGTASGGQTTWTTL